MTFVTAYAASDPTSTNYSLLAGLAAIRPLVTSVVFDGTSLLFRNAANQNLVVLDLEVGTTAANYAIANAKYATNLVMNEYNTNGSLRSTQLFSASDSAQFQLFNSSGDVSEAAALIQYFAYNDTLLLSCNISNTFQIGIGATQGRTVRTDDFSSSGVNTTDFSDVIYGGNGRLTVQTYGGSDAIYTGSDFDSVDAGDGDDVIFDNAGGYTAGNVFTGDVIKGGNGNDTVHLHNPGAGAYLDTRTGQENLAGNAIFSSIETIVGTTGADFIFLNDTDGVANVIRGGDGADQLGGGDGNDTVLGGTGNDSLYGWLGNDDLIGGTGDDSIAGEQGADSLLGDEGNDTLYGDAGNDTLAGGADNDTLIGNEGDDSLYGDDGADTLYGMDGVDRLYGGTGDDGLYGSVGGDSIYGEDGNDTLDGNDDDDLLNGGAGADDLRGGNGFDVLLGGAGNDILNGGAGTIDRMIGQTVTGHGWSYFIALGKAELANLATYATVEMDTFTAVEHFWGGDERDGFLGNDGSHLFNGNDGNDYFVPGLGSDTVQGGVGNRDELYMAGSSKGVTTFSGDDFVNLATGIATRGYTYDYGGIIGQAFVNNTTTISLIEYVDANDGNDSVTGGSANETILGQAGNDTLGGGTGADALNGGGGRDVGVFGFASTAATFSRGAGWSWNVANAGETDNLFGVEVARFADRNVALREAARSDVSGDGTSDLVFYSASAGLISYYEMNPAGGYTWKNIGGVGAGYTPFTGDFNGDGEADVLWFNGTSLSTYDVNPGGGGYVWRNLGSVSSGHQAIVGDYDGDGTSDVAFLNNATGALSWYDINPAGGYTWKNIGSVGAGYTPLTGDFNGDGETDIGWFNGTSLSYYDIGNVGGYTWNNIGSVGPGHTALAGDFNNDGTTDVAFINQTTNAISFYAVNPDGGYTWYNIGFVAPGYNATAADVNNDGKTDIVFEGFGSVSYYDIGPTGGYTWNNIGGVGAGYLLVG
jgi:Ca2+-binding RTX toxin-like protein